MKIVMTRQITPRSDLTTMSDKEIIRKFVGYGPAAQSGCDWQVIRTRDEMPAIPVKLNPYLENIRRALDMDDWSVIYHMADALLHRSRQSNTGTWTLTGLQLTALLSMAKEYGRAHLTMPTDIDEKTGLPALQEACRAGSAMITEWLELDIAHFVKDGKLGAQPSTKQLKALADSLGDALAKSLKE